MLAHLLPRKRSNASKRNMQVGDFVVVADPNAVRGKWQAGRVVEAFPGEDNLVRNVKVTTAKGSTHDRLPKSVLFTLLKDLRRMLNRNSPLQGGMVRTRQTRTGTSRSKFICLVAEGQNRSIMFRTGLDNDFGCLLYGFLTFNFRYVYAHFSGCCGQAWTSVSFE